MKAIMRLSAGAEITRGLSSEPEYVWGKDVLVEHGFISLWESVLRCEMSPPLCVRSSCRSWRVVPGRFQLSAVAPDGPGGQSGGHRSGHAGEIRELWLGDELQPPVQWHRTQLETVPARRQHLGRTSFSPDKWTRDVIMVTGNLVCHFSVSRLGVAY